MRRIPAAFLLLGLVLTAWSCNVVKEMQQAAVNLSRCKFKLSRVSEFSIAGVHLAGKSNLTPGEGMRLLSSFGNGTLPASFTLDVAAINPNDGTGGTLKSAATLTSFAWTLLVDNVETIHGDIASPIVIPGTGQEATIPLRMSLDLLTFFRERGYEHLVNLALNLGGASGSAARLTLRARPTIRTDVGPITYPGELTLVDREFR
jgi:hypothetical protein